MKQFLLNSNIAFLLFATNAFGIIIPLPDLLKQSTIIKLETPIIIEGEKINVLGFYLPNKNGNYKGDVVFGTINGDGHLKSSKKAGIYSFADTTGNITVEYNSNKYLLEGNEGNNFFDKNSEADLIKISSKKLTPMYQKVDYVLGDQIKNGEIVNIEWPNTKEIVSEFIMISSEKGSNDPASLEVQNRNGSIKVNVLKLANNGEVQFGTIKNGKWVNSSSYGSWNFLPGYFDSKEIILETQDWKGSINTADNTLKIKEKTYKVATLNIEKVTKTYLSYPKSSAGLMCSRIF